ncbi:MAG: hypothetical protein MHM6MM_009087 [Cercozoa sp. M6MM]
MHLMLASESAVEHSSIEEPTDANENAVTADFPNGGVEDNVQVQIQQPPIPPRSVTRLQSTASVEAPPMGAQPWSIAVLAALTCMAINLHIATPPTPSILSLVIAHALAITVLLLGMLCATVAKKRKTISYT